MIKVKQNSNWVNKVVQKKKNLYSTKDNVVDIIIVLNIPLIINQYGYDTSQHSA